MFTMNRSINTKVFKILDQNSNHNCFPNFTNKQKTSSRHLGVKKKLLNIKKRNEKEIKLSLNIYSCYKYLVTSMDIIIISL